MATQTDRPRFLRHSLLFTKIVSNQLLPIVFF